jgi:hypothetical protein
MNIKTEYIPICRATKCALRTVFIIILHVFTEWLNCRVISRHLRLNQLTNHKVRPLLHSSQFCTVVSSVSSIQPAYSLLIFYARVDSSRHTLGYSRSCTYIFNLNCGWNRGCSHGVFDGVPQSCRRLSECITETGATCPSTYTFLECVQPTIKYDTW